MTMRLAEPLSILLVLFISLSCVADDRFGCCTQYERWLEKVPNEIITTTACSKILDPAEYVARLDVSYMYSLEFSERGYMNQSVTLTEQQPQLLQSIERAIATSVASTLHQCNAQHQPVYGVPVSSDDDDDSNLQQHVILPVSNSSNFNASCPSVPTSATQDDVSNISSSVSRCLVVRGVTSVLFEESGANQNVSTIDSIVYTLIEATLGNVQFLSQFVVTQPGLKNVQLTFSQYVQPTGGNFVLLPRKSEQSGSTFGTFKVAITTSVLVASLLSTALLLIVLFRQHKIHRDSSPPDAVEVAKKNGIAAKKRRRRDPFPFEALEDICSTNEPDDSLPSGWMIVANSDVPVASGREAPPQETSSRLPVVTTTWSDLTSDSESIMSSLHLDRIDEEVGECSYEQDENGSVNHATRSTGQNDFENVEVSLSNRNWDEEIASWPSSILPLSLSRHPAIPFNELFDTNVSRYGFFDPHCDVDMNIEVSLQKEIMYSSTIPLGSENIEVVEEEWKNHRDTSQSFTFSLDSDTKPSSDGAYIEPFNTSHTRIPVPTSDSEHFYDDEDFQSIEMCVVWMDEDKDKPADESSSAESPADADFPAPLAPDVLLGCQFANDENDASSGYETSFQEESLAAESVERHVISKEVPSSVSQRLTPPESDITDANDMMKSSLRTESTWSNVYTFSSSDAYRSDLEVNSSPTLVGDRTKDPADSDSRTVIAHWAREVMLRLMSGSPKMLRCGAEMEFNSNDSESLY